jgi:aminoglycoside 2''-phosphotransferase
MIEEQLRQRIQTIMPEIEIQDLERNTEGLINDIIIVNHELVFRFAKNEGFAQILNMELDILDLVRPRVNLPVPSPLYRGPGSVVYPLISGKALLRETILNLEAARQQSLAEQLGAFLHDVHTTPLNDLDWEMPPTMAPVTHAKWMEIRARVVDRVYPLLLSHQITWAERLFDSVLSDPAHFAYTPALIHGDLAPYHILYDAPSGEITGVIDFGIAGRGDPALDLGTLITHYGEGFVRQMQPAYAGLDSLLERARFYAQAIELQWALLGLETGDQFWFTAHLGTARDVLA